MKRFVETEIGYLDKVFRIVGTLYRVSQKKQNGGFSVLCLQKVDTLSTSLGKASSAEKNDTKIIEFGEYALLSKYSQFQILYDFGEQ